MTDEFIDNLPKAELHVHIEGTLEPDMMFAFAQRNGVSLPYGSIDAVRAAYQFSNLQEFLDLYYQGMAVLREERDFYELTRAYLQRAHADKVMHAEIFFDPQGHTQRGVSFATVMQGIGRALEDGERELGMSTRLIMCFLRDLSPDSAMETLEQALAYKQRIIAVGLDSAEVGHPPSDFREVFDRARAEGFLTVAHAGEEGPPEYVYQALDLLCVERIDHGNRALEDPALVARLCSEKKALTVCPLSNLALAVVSDMRAHPLRQMMAQGLFVTINSDDPAYFGGYVNENYRAVKQALGLHDADLYVLARNSLLASFLDEQRRDELLRYLDGYVAAFDMTLQF